MYLFVWFLMLIKANCNKRTPIEEEDEKDKDGDEDEDEPDWFGDRGWFVCV